MNARTCRNCGLNFGPEFYTDKRGDSKVCDACKRSIRERDGVRERFDEAEYRKIMGCVPFVEPDAGVSETQAAMQSALDEIKRLNVQLDRWKRFCIQGSNITREMRQTLQSVRDVVESTLAAEAALTAASERSFDLGVPATLFEGDDSALFEEWHRTIEGSGHPPKAMMKAAFCAGLRRLREMIAARREPTTGPVCDDCQCPSPDPDTLHGESGIRICHACENRAAAKAREYEPR